LHRYLKAGAFLLVFLLIAAGRWVASQGIFPSKFSVALSYGLLLAGIAVFTVDLSLVRSLLQRKILYIKILAAGLIIVGVLDSAFELSGSAATITLSFSTTVLVILIVLDAVRSGGPEFRISTTDRMPQRYRRRRPIKTAAETLLRLFPFPEPVGLYRIGSAGADSPVLVTGNFELTVRRVCSALNNLDCWLLVCDSRGVNVWCSSMAGHFTTEKVVQAVERTGLAERVNTRLLILPQLCASAVSLEGLKERSGFHARFGPLYIRDIRRYLENPSDPDIRSAVFPLKDRLQMALGAPILLSIVVALIYNFIGLDHLLVVLPLLYLASLLHASVFPRRPLIRIGPWALLYGAAVFLLAGLLSRGLFPERVLLYALTVGVGAVYLVTEFSGWSPLLKYSLIPYKKPRVKVEEGICTGCRRCVEVCPRAVFRMNGETAEAVLEGRCVICRSCFNQCPTGAVKHSHAGSRGL
jgi:NAD-dependent dihydropyrimidine dehydrogenase PreA subunit